MDDKDILTLYFNRDEGAIVQTQNKYGKRMYSVVRTITEDNQDAEEGVNDVWDRAWKTIPPKRPENLFAYLCRIARNIAFDICDRKNAQKRGGKTVALTDELCECLPDRGNSVREISDSEAIRMAIRNFLDGESEQVRYMFCRRYFYGDQVSKIAEGLGKPENTVAAALYKARARLKMQLEKENITL